MEGRAPSRLGRLPGGLREVPHETLSLDNLIDSIPLMKKNGWLIDVRRFHELRGRLGFMSQVLVWIRPFLAPRYAGSRW